MIYSSDITLNVISEEEIPYRMKICTEFNLATWLRLVEFKNFNISEFGFINFNCISYH